MKIAIGTDHAGYTLKEFLRRRLAGAGHVVLDMGTHSLDPVDYPDFIRPVAEAVIRGEAERGIVLGGSGQGECIAANKLPGIRAALCHDTYTARMSPEHNNANVLALGGRVIGEELAWDVVTAWLANRWTGEERHARRIDKIAGWERDRRFPLRELNRQGQSVWCDYIDRSMLRSGELRRLIREGVSGVTSNPTIFEKAISISDDYALDIRGWAQSGRSPREIVQVITIADIRDTAAFFRSMYELSQGTDGFASLELPPDLAHDTQASIEAAKALWRELFAPNAMIKVPGTPEGIPAIEELIASGVNVNVTLLFGLDAYEAAANAYITGLERRVRARQPVDGIASVASFFVSRVDTSVDKLLQGREEALLGKVAIANSKKAYEIFHRLTSGARWRKLAERGAHPQRLLWASTSTKNAAYRDILYVEELIGRDTVNTMPPATLDAFLDHGYVRPSLEESPEAAGRVLADLASVGIDLRAVTDQLLSEGVQAFASSYEALVKAVAKQAKGTRSKAKPGRKGNGTEAEAAEDKVRQRVNRHLVLAGLQPNYDDLPEERKQILRLAGMWGPVTNEEWEEIEEELYRIRHSSPPSPIIDEI